MPTIGSEVTFEAWQVPCLLIFLLSGCMLYWSSLQRKHKSETMRLYIAPDHYWWMQLPQLAAAVIGLLMWAAIPWNIIVAMLLLSLTTNLGAPPAAVDLAGFWLLASWILSTMVIVLPIYRRYASAE